jgi:anaerobic selenocysteine-containing dehydrogenase
MKNRDQERIPIEKQEGVKAIQTNCFECHSKCGVISYVKDGRLVKVTGNPADPRSRGVMCSKGQAATQVLYSPDRLDYCLRRTRPKTDPDPGWERISYEEAMNIVSDRIETYRQEFGARSVAVGQGTGRGMNQWTLRLGNAIGYNHGVGPGHICMGPMLLTSLVTIGSLPFLDGVNVEHTDCYVVWGANPLWTEAGVTAHRFTRFMNRGGKLIVIDPLFMNPLAHKADIWLPIRPGTDGALVLAWIHVILEEELYNEEFIKNWTNGCHLVETKEGNCLWESDVTEEGEAGQYLVWDSESDHVRKASDPGGDPALFGEFDLKGRRVKTALQLLKERVSDCTPERVAELTWLDEDMIRDAARMYAAHSPGACIETMQGVEETPGCVGTIRGLTVLMMLTGNLDAKGGNILHPFWRDMIDPRLTGNPPPNDGSGPLADEPSALYPATQPRAFWHAASTGEPYPVKMLIMVAGNPMSFNENPSKVKGALQELEFLVVRDYFMSETARYADIVMPAAHWTERDYIADEVCGRWYYAQQKSVEPIGERTSDLTFLRELGNRINPDVWPWETDEEVLDFQLEPLGITWQDLKEEYCHEIEPERYRKYASGDPKWQIPTFSSKFEIYSNLMKASGFDPLPYYMEPPESHIRTPDLARDYPLVLTTGTRTPYFYHSTFHNIPWLRSMQQDPQCFINTRTAREEGIEDGDWVWIETPNGRARARALLTEGIHPKVVSAQHGWGMGCKELGLRDLFDDEVNINDCISDEHAGREVYTPLMRGLLCRVVPARGKGEAGE